MSPNASAEVLTTELLRALESNWPAKRYLPVSVVVGVSGGADSVALLRLLHFARARSQPGGSQTTAGQGQLIVAHFNHGLRGAESEADQSFVEQLAEQLGLQCFVERAEQRPAENTEQTGGSAATASEASLRTARYAFFDELAHRLGARYVAVAHTADDQVETHLHQLFRGSGPSGLAGMPPYRALGKDAILMRPLLHVQRQQLRGFLKAIEQPWREDASNQETVWQRNWIRHEVLPLIEQRYPAANSAILRAAVAQRQWLMDWKTLSDELSSHILEFAHSDGNGPESASCLKVDWSRAPKVLRLSTLLVSALQNAWDTLQWPRRSMGQHQWKLMRDFIMHEGELTERSPSLASPDFQTPHAHNSPTTLNLPGNLRASRCESGLVVVKCMRGD